MENTFTIAVICGKLGGVDGVSLEVDKWIHILLSLGHTVYTIAGTYTAELSYLPGKNQLLLPEIAFNHPDQLRYEKIVFPYLSNNHEKLSLRQEENIMSELMKKGHHIASKIYEIIQKNDIDVIIAENTNAMPMTLTGGTAVHELVKEKRMATIFHHHDFWWERSRFSNNHIEPLLDDIMPPYDLGVEHVVLTSYAEHILRSIKRVQPIIIPNCENFDNPVKIDEYNSTFREDFGFTKKDILVIQPTRIVRRKRIEDSIRLLGLFIKKYPQYKKRIQYIISLYQGDEPDDHYINEINDLASKQGIPVHHIADRVSSQRGVDADGKKLYTNRDVIVNADLVTYLPIWEGFGNALLEAIAARVPVITTTYLVYKTDIKVAGVRNIEIRDQYDPEGRLIIQDKVLDDMAYILTHDNVRNEIVDTNYNVAKNEFGFNTLKFKLKTLINNYSDEIRASRKRIMKSKIYYSV
ncbi:MAG: glycosyltransferase family 4 protein [Spirochaetales bacterium]|nr:glycosyltransferase family 4 protein [Spirochaetales bacterium]